MRLEVFRGKAEKEELPTWAYVLENEEALTEKIGLDEVPHIGMENPCVNEKTINTREEFDERLNANRKAYNTLLELRDVAGMDISDALEDFNNSMNELLERGISKGLITIDDLENIRREFLGNNDTLSR